jgi:O-antigen ligase
LTPTIFGLLALTLVAIAVSRGARLRTLLVPSVALGASLAFAAYLLLNAIWAADISSAYAKAGSFLAIVLAAFASVQALKYLDDCELRKIALGFVAGASLGALFVLLEVVTGGAVSRAAMNLETLLKPVSAKHRAILHGKVVKISPAEFNPHATILTLHLWTGLLLIARLAGLARRWLLGGLYVAAIALPVALSEHDSSQLALVVSPIVALIAWKWSRATIKSLAVLWCAAFVLAVPLAFAAYDGELHMAKWLPASAKARVIIWDTTAELTLRSPWIGVGIGSTPALRDQMKQLGTADQPEGFVFPRLTGQHAHDVFLQTWYELGLAGALLAAIAGAAVILRMLNLPRECQPFGAAAFAALLSIASFAWGMWQGWYMAAIGLIPIYLFMASLAVASPARGEARQPMATQ